MGMNKDKNWQPDTFGEFLRVVDEACKGNFAARRLLKTSGHLEEGQGSMGGYTVPTQFHNEVMTVALEESVVRPRARIVEMESDIVEIPIYYETSHASTVFGGISATWADEAESPTASTPSLGQITLEAKKVVGYVALSNDLMTDSGLQIESFLRQAFGSAVAYYADEKYLIGSGFNEPLGILNAGCTASQDAEEDQTATTIVWNNITKMDSQLLGQCQNRAVWYAHPDVKPQLYRMDTGADNPATVMDLSGRNGIWVYGHQVIYTEKCKTLGTVGDLILADPYMYVIGNRGIQVASSALGSGFSSDETLWRFVLRTAGQPILSSSITPRNGSTALSPFVTLATRSA